MQSRRATLTPLAIVLPHPHLPHRRSSLLSLNSAASPHTPRSCPSPCPPPSAYYPANRKSTDSWNSSNADDMDFDWKPEQVLLLSRTLDALPAHLVTPFNGPIPPSNLLDKIARGVSQAKGPLDWPHSIRATRVKLIELSRARAKEEEQRRQAIPEEVEIEDGSYQHDSDDKPVRGARRPLYRQSSMDFIKPDPAELKDNPTIARLSTRLQRSDRTFHPYSRSKTATTHRRSSSPPHLSDVPALINPSTPSSSTLSSLSSSAQPHILRRSASTLSSGSLLSASSSGMSLQDPRIQRIRRAESFCSGPPPAPPPKDCPPTTATGFKRMPSYGAIAQEVRHEGKVALEHKPAHVRQLSGSYPSSDEEEKARATKRAKKTRTKTASVVPQSPSSPPSSPVTAFNSTPTLTSKPLPPQPPAKEKTKKRENRATPPPPAKPDSTTASKSPKSPSTTKRAGKPHLYTSTEHAPARRETGIALDNNNDARARSERSDMGHVTRETDSSAAAGHKSRPRMNAQRNPSMFGAELPHLRSTQPTSLSLGLVFGSPATPPTPACPLSPASPVSTVCSRSPSPVPLSPTLSPASPRVKTLRRVRRLVPARRISFGSLLASSGDDEARMDLDSSVAAPPMGSGGGLVFGAVLGSAFSVRPRALRLDVDAPALVPTRSPRTQEKEKEKREGRKRAGGMEKEASTKDRERREREPTRLESAFHLI